jgi:TolB-like protein
MKKTMFALAAVAVLAAPVTSYAQAAATKPGVGVLPFESASIDPNLAPLGKGIPAILINELSRNTSIRVVEREAIQKILDEQKLGTSGSLDPATVIKVGKLIGALYMITGSFVTNPAKDMQISVRCFSVETGEIIYSETAKGTTNGLIELIQQAGAKATAGLKLPPIPASAKGEAELGAAQTKKMPLATAMLYARAIEAEDSGKKDQAKQLYSQVQSSFPYPPAKAAIDRLSK